MRRLWLIFLLMILSASRLIVSATSLSSSESLEQNTEESPQEKAHDLDMNKFIFAHIGDSYEWHITEIDGHPVSIYLPVIVRGKDGDWHIFSSKKISHGAEYKGFFINEDGKIRQRLNIDSSKNEKFNIENASKNVEATTESISDIEQHTTSKVSIEDQHVFKPLDLSITKNVLGLMVNSLIVLLIILLPARWYRKHDGMKEAPRGFTGLIEMLTCMLLDEIIRPCVGKDYKKYMSFLLTIFFFIFVNNIMGIVPFFPGGANVTGNIAVTLCLALFTFLAVNIFGNKHYWKEILWPDVPVPLKCPLPLMPLLEIVGIFTKPFSLMVRLFANITAGHIMLLGVVAVVFLTANLAPALNSGLSAFAVVFGVFMDVLELLVAFIQAYVFTMLSSVFIGLSRQSEH